MSLRAWLGIAISGFPEFEQFCIAGFPGEHSSFSLSPLRMPFRHARARLPDCISIIGQIRQDLHVRFYSAGWNFKSAASANFASRQLGPQFLSFESLPVLHSCGAAASSRRQANSAYKHSTTPILAFIGSSGLSARIRGKGAKKGREDLRPGRLQAPSIAPSAKLMSFRTRRGAR